QRVRQAASGSQPDREIYRQYERDRRLRLARVLLPIFALIQAAIFLISLLFLLVARYGPPIREIFALNTALLGLCGLAQLVGLCLLRRRQVTAATLCVVLPVGVTVVVPLLGYDLLDRSALSTASPIMSITLGETAGTVVLIVLAGLLASNRWTL